MSIGSSVRIVIAMCAATHVVALNMTAAISSIASSGVRD